VPDARPWQSRPDEAYRVLEDARAVIAQGCFQDHWFGRRPASSPLGAQSSRPSHGLDGVASACLVGARWNDQPGRTREEVLGLVDLAASRAVMAAVSGPR